MTLQDLVKLLEELKLRHRGFEVAVFGEDEEFEVTGIFVDEDSETVYIDITEEQDDPIEAAIPDVIELDSERVRRKHAA